MCPPELSGTASVAFVVNLQWYQQKVQKLQTTNQDNQSGHFDQGVTSYIQGNLRPFHLVKRAHSSDNEYDLLKGTRSLDVERYSHPTFSPRPSRVLPSIEPLLKLSKPLFHPAKKAADLSLVVSTILHLHLFLQRRTDTASSNTLTIPFHHTPSPHLSSYPRTHTNPRPSHDTCPTACSLRRTPLTAAQPLTLITKATGISPSTDA